MFNKHWLIDLDMICRGKPGYLSPGQGPHKGCHYISHIQLNLIKRGASHLL